MEKWREFHRQLPILSKFEIPRWIGCNNTTINTLHGFADASKSAYGAVVYMRSVHINGDISVSLVMSRQRVAPIKTISIPRLELCAAELLAQLVQSLISECQVKLSGTTLSTDSKIVLQWLQKLPINLDTFVGNRVSTIQSITNKMTWKHVPSNQNPADLITRGLMPNDFVKNKMWKNGPDWLKQEEETWPDSIITLNEEEQNQMLSEFRKQKQKLVASVWNDQNGSVLVNTIQISDQQIWKLSSPRALTDVLRIGEQPILERRSTVNSVLRVLAHIFRFINAMKGANNYFGPVKKEEYEQALQKMIQIEQGIAYKQDISNIVNDKPITNNSKLIQLSPWLDTDGILKVGGRIQNSELTFNEKHPIILPKESKLTRLIVRDVHMQTMHGGSQLMRSVIRQTYWVPHLQQVIRSCITKCVVCTRFKQKTINQMMANLPAERLRPARSFRQVGIDYAGPVIIKARYDRRCKTLAKGYIAVFVCLISKAVHLEVVESLKSETFLDALSRFMARRGPIDCIWSDNGTNFVGAAKELKEIHNIWEDDITQKQLQALRISWKFITPAAPHQGGLWEAAVKSMKHHLRRIMKNQVFTLPELTTLVCEIESCMNSRPLTSMSDDPQDLAAITPAHFLIGEPLIQPYHPTVRDIPENRLNARQLIKKFTQIFWDRFKADYILTLQQKNKWFTKEPNIKVNDLVIIKNEQLPPSLWQLARVIEVHPGPDGLIRNTTLRTENSIIQRPIQKLCSLPKESDCLN